MNPRTLISEAAITIVAAALISLAAWVGATEALGAHPWWAVKVGVGGALGGAFAYGALRGVGLSPRRLAQLSALIAVVGFAAAVFGKRAFAASFAENALAGRFWFIGWIVAAAALCALFAALATGWTRRRP